VDRWEVVFDELVDLDATERLARLAEIAREDPDLARKVEAVLAADQTELQGPRPIFERAPALVAAAMGSLADTDPGRRIGPYRVVSLLGRGGMGEVYLAERADGEYQQRVAIKTVRADFGSAQILERFLRERQILAGLDHPGIARLLDGGRTAEGQPYFVLELVEGQPITGWCAARGVGLERRLELLREVCDAVDAAHRRQIVHRDIKPTNVLVTQDGRPKLLDFGIAKVLAADAGPAELTQADNRLLTPAYAAPEQILGEPVTIASDVFALGVLLYELLCGQAPFSRHGRSLPELARLIETERPTRPSVAAATGTADPTVRSFAKRLPGDLEQILGKALHREPERRYASAGELGADLDRFLRGLPVRARPDSLLYRSSKFLRRHAWAALGGVVVVLSLGAAIAALTLRDRPAAIAAADDIQLERRLAVTRFRDAVGKSETAWLALAMTDLVTAELAHTADLEVASGEEVVRMAAELGIEPAEGYAADSLRRIERSLNVGWVVSGSVVVLPGEPERVQVAARLQRSGSGTTAATVSRTGPTADLLELASATADAVRETLGLPVSTLADRERFGARLPDDTTARRTWAQGLDAFRRFDLRSARDQLDATVDTAPDFAPGWLALARTRRLMGDEMGAREAARRAFELAASLPDADRWRVEATASRLARDTAAAVDTLARLVTRDPGNVEDRLEHSRALFEAGQIDAALATVTELLQHNPAAGRDARVELQVAIIEERLGRRPEALAATERGQTAARLQGSPRLEAEHLIRRASIAAGMGPEGIERGLEALAAGEKLLEQARDPALAMRLDWARGNLEDGAARTDPKRFAASEQAFRRALEIARSTGMEHHELNLLQSLAHAQLMRGDLRAAEAELRTGLARAETLAIAPEVAGIGSRLAYVLRLRGELAEARRLTELNIERHRALEDPAGEAESATEMAELELAAGRPEAALRLWRPLIERFRELGHGASAAWVEVDSAWAEVVLARPPADLVERLRAALDAEGRPRDLWFEGYTRAALAAALLRFAAPDVAVGEVTRARELAPLPSRPGLTLRIARTYAEALLALGRLGEAETAARELLSASQTCGSALGELDAQALLAAITGARGQVEWAEQERREVELAAAAIGYHNLPAQRATLGGDGEAATRHSRSSEP
jgi:serine/threonine protein kinase/tetratricopeptide (TPR) repeat protein/TolB-like protein